MDVETYLKKDYIENLLSEGKRIDGRKFDEYRKIDIKKGYVSEKCAGSALAKLGSTQVLAGISMSVGEPYPDQPEKGVMMVGAELRPLASSEFELGPPGEDATELARVVDRGIRESECIELDKLFIEEGKVWVVFIDLHVLDHVGNLIDASGLAAIAALLDAEIPKYEDGEIIRDEIQGKLPVKEIPVPCTLAKIKDKLVLDPNLDEEYALDSRLTVTTTDVICAMQKGGKGRLTQEDIYQGIDWSFEKGKEIRKLIKEL